MAQTKNDEPRRMWRRGAGRDRCCVSCGARSTTQASDLAFCHECIERSRQTELSEWDDLGAAD